MNTDDETLLIHLGGLGDICLSESAFLTLSRHFRSPLHAVGAKRVLERFGAYFPCVDSIDARAWTYLFSDSSQGRRWKRIVFFGKDRGGGLRRRLGELTEELFFVDLYPDAARIPVEEHHLAQLAAYGMKPEAFVPLFRKSDRLILYPEAGFEKRKWPLSCFERLFGEMKRVRSDVILMTPPGLRVSVADTVSLEGLDEIESFFSEGGLFFSNDSGMAHFASRCGLHPITLFWEAAPDIWRPKGARILRCEDQGPAVQEVVDLILAEMEAMKGKSNQ